jgi:hypothetical protein
MPAGVVPVARSQETLWEFVRCFAPVDPGALGYNVFQAGPRTGPLDPNALRHAVRDVLRRHDALRIVFAEVADDPLIRFADDLEPIVTFVDVTGEPPQRRSVLVGSVLGWESGRAFDTRSGPLWSVVVVQTTDTTWTVGVTMFHLIADGWSTGVFLRDLDTAYQARTAGGSPLPELTLTYRAATGRPGWDEGELRRRAQFWRRQLLPLPDALPFGPPGAPVQPDVGAAASVRLGLSADLARRLHGYARRVQVTPFVLSMAAYRITLGALTGAERIVLGTATAGRDEPGMAQLVGQFTQNIYVATTIGPRTTLAEAVSEVWSATMAAMRHVSSFLEIARAVNPDFDTSRPWPFLLLYHSWFQSAAPALGNVGDQRLSEQRSRARVPAAADIRPERLSLWAKRGEPGLTMGDDRRHIEMNYNPTWYDRDGVVAAVLGYRSVLEQLLRDPDRRVGDVELGT